ncbi:hypothetical protein [Roseibium sediminis]|uniref:hypothetical protein n=1 Tax=Roseibium sediminis TaxID=1775174 RepID=UPI00123D5575|nr:hypothetical protein [Roseibium sediminis]
MREPKSTATIVALADLAEFSADQLERGHSVENVIALLRRAAIAVRETVDFEPEEAETSSGFEPIVISNNDEIVDADEDVSEEEEAIEVAPVSA